MTLRKAKPQEAEILWNIRNQAIRHGCKTSYDADVIGVVSENGIYGHSRFCNTDFDDKLACLNLSGV
ncbi:hypothetical protein KZX48_11915 [Enterobacter asburiae]|uniref:Uncharacterized protein n=1 Tax=Enterobacter asburiae TaxID=61645 RepID=A0AAQ0EUV9_ENTAS|nr:hypothetical protein KZX48_11915 [Enterobacter asburiae]